MNKRILIIVEGEKRESYILNHVSSLVSLTVDALLIYGTDVYALYKDIMQDKFEALNTFNVIKEHNKVSTIKYRDKNSDIFNKYTSNDFAYIYLFFDFDPQATENNTKSLEMVGEMLKIFDNSTERGKLYINYPSVESFNHITDNFQELYYQYSKNSDSYKSIAGEYIPKYKQYSQIKKIDHHHLQELIKLHLNKANFICNGSYTLPNNIDDVKQVVIFGKQLLFYNEEQKTYILSSIPLFLFELFGSKILCFDKLAANCRARKNT